MSGQEPVLQESVDPPLSIEEGRGSKLDMLFLSGIKSNRGTRELDLALSSVGSSSDMMAVSFDAVCNALAPELR